MFTHRKNPLTVPLLLSTLLVVGCASEPKPISHDLREHLGKVYLNSAGATGETFFHTDFKNGSVMGDAGKNAVDALDQCLGGALMGGSLAPVILMACAPINVPMAMMKAHTPSSKPEISKEELADVEEKTTAILQHADLTPALVATIDDESQHNAYLTHYEISHGVLPSPENGETIIEVAAKWDYQTVAEIRIIEAGFESDAGKAPLLHFSMTAEVKLVETKSGSVLDKQEYRYDGKPQPYKFWFSNEPPILPEEIKKANVALANKILDKVFIK
ncbi:MAG TPA: hypothetical protein VLB90_07000 [Pseudomonadales bacterium]|nr:hypothetical protein [Pseudomonadales bacterium]